MSRGFNNNKKILKTKTDYLVKNLVFLMKIITIVSSEHFSSIDKPTYSYYLYLLNFTYLAKGYTFLDISMQKSLTYTPTHLDLI